MKKISSQKGFTLIEIMVVVVIIGILAALIVPNIMGRTDQAKVTATRTQIEALGQSLDMYRLDNHVYPSTEQGLKALIEKPAGNPEPKNWAEGGYLKKKKIPMDGWDHEFIYVSPGTHGGYDLYSYGADGKEGGEGLDADIKSWE